jgi:hypothetical protein
MEPRAATGTLEELRPVAPFTSAEMAGKDGCTCARTGLHKSKKTMRERRTLLTQRGVSSPEPISLAAARVWPSGFHFDSRGLGAFVHRMENGSQEVEENKKNLKIDHSRNNPRNPRKRSKQPTEIPPLVCK